jgi:hypothetical protein
MLRNSCGIIRELELALKFFNLVFAGVLWMSKMAMLCCAVLGGFSAIRLLNQHSSNDNGNNDEIRRLLLTMIYILFGVNGIIFYTGMFQISYKVTESSAELIRLVQFSSSRLIRDPASQISCRMILKSVCPMAMSVGGFHKVERESVPIFVDFVVKLIVNLLLTL